MKTFYQHPNWWMAFRLIEPLVPGLSGLDLDDLFTRLSPEEWRPLVTDARSDDEVWRDLRPQIIDRLHGSLIVITDSSFSDSVGPLFVDAEDLDRLVGEHVERFGDVMFSGGNVSFWSPASGVVVTVHHDGNFALLPLRPRRGDPMFADVATWGT